MMDRSTGLLGEIVRTGLLEPSEVHQAVGMIIVQLALSPIDALARLRATADLSKVSTLQIAERVINRSLRLSTDGATPR